MTSAVFTTLQRFEVSAESRALWSAVAVMLLTTVHHSYGAVIYNTPWRYHVAIVGVATVLVLFASLRVRRSLAGNLAAKIAFGLFATVALLIPVLGIGVFEGGYNHGLKDVLYFSGAGPELMNRLFPAPTYEMPNDGFFEITGVLQFPLAVFTGLQLLKAIRLARKS